MASKTKKSGTPAATAIPRPSSPLSPTRHSRLQEKADLQNLNDRLASYIDKVRYLEAENGRLTREIQTSQETVTREVSNIKAMYDHELSDARKLLDETHREKARLEIDVKRLLDENDELKADLAKRSKDLVLAENSARIYETRCNELQLKYNQANSDAKKALSDLRELEKEHDKLVKRLLDENEALKADLAKKGKDIVMAENSARIYETRCNELQLKYNQAITDAKKAVSDLRDLEKERDKLKKLLDEHRKQLEEESLARVEVENSNQSLREELSFKDQVYQQQLTETRTRKQVEISEIDGRLAEKYEEKLHEALQELRDQYEGQMANNRQEIEMLYENKIKNLQSAANRHSQAAATALEEARSVRTRIDSLTSRINQLENENSGLTARARDVEKFLENERLRHAEDLAALEGDLARLREELSNQLHEYQDLMDIKVSLDLEIAAYRKLLESEEARLNITPGTERELSHSSSTRSSSQRRQTPVRAGAKRKRTFLEESQESSLSDYSVSNSTKGDIEIVEADPEGKFVKLHNKSNQEISLGGWHILRRVGEDETKYKFIRSAKLEGKGTVTVWSSDLGKDHEPPHNLVMKTQKWVVGDNMTTTLLNSDGDEVAVSERIKRQVSSSHLRHREMAGGYLGGSEELHHQHGDPQGDEKCRLM